MTGSLNDLLLLQEDVVKALGSHLDEGTLESLGRAEQLSRNLSDLNELIEGGKQTNGWRPTSFHQFL